MDPLLVTFVLLGQNTKYLQVKGAIVYCGSQYIGASVYSWLVPRQGSMAEKKNL